ncbi:hypothetical protein [Aneurinibacillus aneurinilyticus]|uniref:hypothetical protein n=1 Tax=Aneurinibacillus aneurinilyticus TaxID=1391 RepID=UPI0023F51781|nr:hypothetical protein [Aneurinibacillus aneurinilyticus]
MAYNKQTWKDEIPDLTKPIKDASGKQKTDPQTGRPLYELVQEGTRITSARLNHAEQGIEDAHILIEQLAQEWGGSFVASPNGTAGFQFTVSGLTVSWTAGVGYVAGRRFDVAAGSLTLNPTQGQYIYLDTDGVVKRTTSQTTANAGLLLWYFATDASKVITSTDRRRTITPDTFAKKEEVVLKEPGKGLSTNDYNNTEKAKVQEHGERLQYHDQRLTVIEDEMGEADPIPATLKPGIQTITADRTTPFNVSSIKGRTLVNLLGRDGNCEDISKWKAFQGTVVTDSTNKTVGNNGIKLTITSSTFATATSITKINGKAGKYYLAVVDARNGNGTDANFYISNTPTPKGTHYTTDTMKFNTVWRAYAPTTDFSGEFIVQVNGTANQYAYFDAIRLYEITAAEYAALDNMTPEQIAAKYPYVDDVKPVRNPYAIRYGKNLLPPFTEWALHANAKIVTPYKLMLEASGDEQWSTVDIKVIPGQTYTLSMVRNGKVSIHDNAPVKPISLYTEQTNTNGTLTATFTATATGVIRIHLFNANGTTGTFTFEKPMLNIGDTALPFEPQNNDYVFYDTVLHSNVDGTVRDELFYRDGQPRKLKRIEVPLLAGHLPWEMGNDATGFKQVRWKYAGDGVPGSGIVVKHDGKIIPQGSTLNVPDTHAVSADGYVYVSIADTDSGWGENYTPSEGEIKAYFNGWRMYQQDKPVQPYDGTGTRAWAKIDSRTGTHIEGSGTTTLPTQSHEYWYTPYRLIYQLAQPVEVPVTSEGKITLHESTNVLEVGTGVVIREKANVQLYNNEYFINGTGMPLSNRVDKFISSYKNETLDLLWTTGNTETVDIPKIGLVYKKVSPAYYDPTAAYSVTYLVLDRYAFTAPLIDLQGEYAKTVAGVLALEAKNAADVETRVSVATMFLDKILRGEISVGTDFSKQIPKSMENNIYNASTTHTLLDISGKGYFHSFSIAPDRLASFFVGLYIDGNRLFDARYPLSNNSGNTNNSQFTYSGLLRFNKSLKITVRNGNSINEYAYTRILYSLDS